MAGRIREVTDRRLGHGFDVEMGDLWYPGDRTDVADYLDTHGWDATFTIAADLLAAQGLSLQSDSDDDAAMFGSLAYVTATRG